MKPTINKPFAWLAALVACLFFIAGPVSAQEEKTADKPVKAKPVKNTFQSIWIIDNQTVMVPIKKTFEMDIQHRFGTWNKGYEDFWGMFAPSNIRLGFSYSPINKLNLGLGVTKSHFMWDASAKYSIIAQTKDKYPVSVTFYTNMAITGTKATPTITIVNDKGSDIADIKHFTDRMYFFHQLIIARKVTDKFSVQVAPSLTHQNAVGGYYIKNDSTGRETYKNMKHDHFAISVAARYKLTPVTSVIFNYDQPITKHPTLNPKPNIGLGVEFNTSSHSFQIFFANYYDLNAQRNSLFNVNDPGNWNKIAAGSTKKGGNFLLGFNITRLWNY